MTSETSETRTDHVQAKHLLGMFVLTLAGPATVLSALRAPPSPEVWIVFFAGVVLTLVWIVFGAHFLTGWNPL